MMKKKVKYVQLEAEAFIADEDFQTMTAAERGVYCTIIFYLYANNGKCRFDIRRLTRLCNCGGFEKIWDKIKSKFYLAGGNIKHKRVNKELRRAGKFIQAQREKGLKGAQIRWKADGPGHSSAKDAAKPKKSERNEIEVKKDNNISNTNIQSLLSSSSLLTRSLAFNEALTATIRPMNQSDRTSFRNIGNWLSQQCAVGKFTPAIFERVLGYADEAARARGNHAAIFTAILKKELEYKK